MFQIYNRQNQIKCFVFKKIKTLYIEVAVT